MSGSVNYKRSIDQESKGRCCHVSVLSFVSLCTFVCGLCMLMYDAAPSKCISLLLGNQQNTAVLNALIHQSDSTSIDSIGTRLFGVVSTSLITGDAGAPRAGISKGVYSGV